MSGGVCLIIWSKSFRDLWDWRRRRFAIGVSIPPGSFRINEVSILWDGLSSLDFNSDEVDAKSGIECTGGSCEALTRSEPRQSSASEPESTVDDWSTLDI